MTSIVGEKVTWFLGSGNDYRFEDPDGHVWFDSGAHNNKEGPFASGLPYNTPGIALPNYNHTLGGWWRVTMPRQNVSMVVVQVDIGPSGVIDLSAALAYLLFTKPADVPDYTPWRAEYLGRELPEGTEAVITNLRTGTVVPIPMPRAA